MASDSARGEGQEVNDRVPTRRQAHRDPGRSADHGSSRPPERDSPLCRGLVRVVVVLALGLLVVLPLLWVTAWLRFAGGRFGWIPTASSFGLVAGAIEWLALPRGWPTARRDAARALAMLAAVGGLATAHYAPATAGRLRHHIAQIEQAGWRLSDDRADGSAACFDYCTSVTRRYVSHAAADDVASQLRPMLLAAGYEDAADAGRAGFRHDGAEFDVVIDVAPGPEGTSVIVIRAAT